MSSHNPNLDQPLEPSDTAEARMRLALGLGTRPATSGAPSSNASPPPASHDTVRQRRRFAQDGDVPVVMLHRGRDGEGGGENKLAGLTAELREERAARQKAERALDEANQTVNSLKTQVKHAEMASDERLRHEREALAQAEALLVTERDARQQAEARAAEAVLALSLLERKVEAAAKPTAVPPAPVELSPAPEPSVAPLAPDLFTEVDAGTAAPAALKRRISKKSAAEPEPSAVAATPVSQPAPEAVDSAEDKPIEWWLPSFRAARKTPIRRKRAAT